MAPCSARFSLLTGNFTGNSPKLRPPATSETPICTQGAEFSSKFPSNKNRELFLTSREFRGSNRDVRFTPENRHVQRTSSRLLRANSGHGWENALGRTLDNNHRRFHLER